MLSKSEKILKTWESLPITCSCEFFKRKYEYSSKRKDIVYLNVIPKCEKCNKPFRCAGKPFDMKAHIDDATAHADNYYGTNPLKIIYLDKQKAVIATL